MRCALSVSLRKSGFLLILSGLVGLGGIPLGDIFRSAYGLPWDAVPGYLRTEIMFPGFAAGLLLMAWVVDILRRRESPLVGGLHLPRLSHVH